ncbi:hypothetical protein SBOR_8595 [Sclerotinia borealis F-4128]|uniref:Uncharacterized protein n=1 Tax=Sclerotinia borealis (strain F-4128) TaxID=1432307 RepID=W9C828_SCLBF|nr:hypothetical protein SBOR_8595 [Sclerotinia borealis F-4128]
MDYRNRHGFHNWEYLRTQKPLKDPALSKAFVDFEDNAVGIISFPLPRFTCAKAYKARENIVAGFEKFYAEDGPATAFHMVQASSEVSDAHGLSINDKSRLDTCNGHAILANTTPTAFWTIYHVLSDEKVLEEVRAAVLSLVTVEQNNGKITRKINIAQIRDIPIMRSVLHEVLRHYNYGTGTRTVLEDTILDNQYLLKKDSFVFMPNRS